MKKWNNLHNIPPCWRRYRVLWLTYFLSVSLITDLSTQLYLFSRIVVFGDDFASRISEHNSAKQWEFKLSDHCLTPVQPVVTFENRPDWINHPAILVTILVVIYVICSIYYIPKIFMDFALVRAQSRWVELARKNISIQDIHACFAQALKIGL